MNTPENQMNLVAFAEGEDTRARDEDKGTLTDNPYSPETVAHRDWYLGYNEKDQFTEPQ